jgi:cytochrome c5
MKWQVAITLGAMAAVFTAATLVKRDRSEKAANEAFCEAVREGDRVYSEVCGRCHLRYDPRFYLYDDWRTVLEDSGCPAVRVETTDEERNAIREFLRAKAAPTQDEAETVRKRERSRMISESALRGEAVFGNLCLECHGNPYYPKTRTQKEWAEALQDLGSLHREIAKPAWLGGRNGEDLLAFLQSRAAGSPSDARAVQALLKSGAGEAEPPVEEKPKEVHWLRDFEAAQKLAKEQKKPMIADFTDLSGG